MTAPKPADVSISIYEPDDHTAGMTEILLKLKIKEPVPYEEQGMATMDRIAMAFGRTLRKRKGTLSDRFIRSNLDHFDIDAAYPSNRTMVTKDRAGMSPYKLVIYDYRKGNTTVTVQELHPAIAPYLPSYHDLYYGSIGDFLYTFLPDDSLKLVPRTPTARAKKAPIWYER